LNLSVWDSYCYTFSNPIIGSCRIRCDSIHCYSLPHMESGFPGKIRRDWGIFK